MPQVASTGVRLGPGDEAVVEQLKTNAGQPLDEDENTTHNVPYPFAKMSKRLRLIVLFLFGINKR
jgi:hypothetical protein